MAIGFGIFWFQQTMQTPKISGTYTGQFTGIGLFTMPVPDWDTNCVFEDDFSGTMSMNITEAADGSISGTGRLILGWTSTPLSGSTSRFTCLSATPSIDKTGAVSGTRDNIKFIVQYTSASGYDAKEEFTGSLSDGEIIGTLVDTSSCCSGSGIMPVTLTALQ